MEDSAFRKILEEMALSWPGYRRVRKAVKRRLSRRMMEIGAATVEDYLHLIREHPSEREAAGRLLTVSISRFFRDRRMWMALAEMIREKEWEGRTSAVAWCAGVACGEEVYSLKILWRELSWAVALPSLYVVATEIHPMLLERARRGVYPRSSVREMDRPGIQRYFTEVGGELAIVEGLTGGILWAVHDFTAAEPPCIDCDFIFMRNNLLTYYDLSVAAPALLRAVEHLREGGLLIIGNNERLPDGPFPLRATSAYRCIFRKESKFETGGSG